MTTIEPDKGYAPASPSRGPAGHGVVPDGRVAPECIVRVRCPKCRISNTVDAYQGPVTCLGGNPRQWYMFKVLWVELWVQPIPPHSPAFMQVEELIL